jgi:hypothetical protein
VDFADSAFEWDESRRNRDRHGVSFEDAARALVGLTSRKVEDRYARGEIRCRAMDSFRVGVSVACSMRGGSVPITSARKASRAARRTHRHAQP